MLSSLTNIDPISKQAYALKGFGLKVRTRTAISGFGDQRDTITLPTDIKKALKSKTSGGDNISSKHVENN